MLIPRIAILAIGAAYIVVAPAAALGGTYVERGGVDVYLQHPSTLVFSVDGDAEAEELHWSGWGAPRAVAQGIIDERNYPSNSRVRVPGTLTLTDLHSCRGNRYYVHGVVSARGHLPFSPNPLRFYTPCSGG